MGGAVEEDNNFYSHAEISIDPPAVLSYPFRPTPARRAGPGSRARDKPSRQLQHRWHATPRPGTTVGRRRVRATRAVLLCALARASLYCYVVIVMARDAYRNRRRRGPRGTAGSGRPLGARAPGRDWSADAQNDTRRRAYKRVRNVAHTHTRVSYRAATRRDARTARRQTPQHHAGGQSRPSLVSHSPPDGSDAHTPCSGDHDDSVSSSGPEDGPRQRLPVAFTYYTHHHRCTSPPR